MVQDLVFVVAFRGTWQRNRMKITPNKSLETTQRSRAATEYLKQRIINEESELTRD